MTDTPMDNAYWRHPSPDTSPQAIWALLRKSAENHEKALLELQEMRLQQQKDAEERRERQKEIDRQMQETRLQQQEIDRQMQETRLQQQEIDRQMQETRLQQHKDAEERRERQKEIDRQMQETRLQQQKDAEERRERQKEIDRQIQEARLQQQETRLQMQETAREMKETNRRFGDLGNRFGELAEHLVAPNIEEKFSSLGFVFEKVALNQRLIDPSGKRYAEIDIILEGQSTVIAVEVKSKPRKEDIDIHISRIEALRQKTDPRISKRFIGAVAGAIMLDEVREYIHQSGLYSIEQTGDTVKISNGEGFIPRQW